MSKYKNRKLLKEEFYDNVLLELGLSKFYIFYNNYYYFGNESIKDQTLANDKIKNIIEIYDDFIDELLNKYNSRALVLEIGTIYDKLQDIHLANDLYLKSNDKLSKEKIDDISYPSKVGDLMARKAKLIIEIVVLKDNKSKNNHFCNRDYRKLVILLYYYSLFIFYRTKSNLSKEYENGIVYFYIEPSSLEPINTYNPEQNNSDNNNKLQYNYDAKIIDEKNEKFDRAFYNEKGIGFDEYQQLMNTIVVSFNKKNKIIKLIRKEYFIDLVSNSYNMNIEKFKMECIYNKNNIMVPSEELYKNNSKIRLDTSPIIDIGKDYYIFNKGIIWNSLNFWNNVRSIGLMPYDGNDDITEAAHIIIEKVSKKFEDEIYNKFQERNDNFIIYRNLHTDDIFGKKDIDDNEWDLIVVDHNKKILFDIEIKFISSSLTERQLANDLNKIGYKKNSYFKKFKKRINIETNNLNEFLSYFKADKDYDIKRLMIISKVTDFDIYSKDREFCIIHYHGIDKFLDELYK